MRQLVRWGVIRGGRFDCVPPAMYASAAFQKFSSYGRRGHLLSWVDFEKVRTRERTVLSMRAHCGTRVSEGTALGNLRVKKPNVNMSMPKT